MKGLKEKNCFGQAVGNNVPLVFINIVVLLFDTGFYLGALKISNLAHGFKAAGVTV